MSLKQLVLDAASRLEEIDNIDAEVGELNNRLSGLNNKKAAQLARKQIVQNELITIRAELKALL